MHLRSCTRRSVSHWLCRHRCCTGVWSCWADDLADNVRTWSHWNCSSNPSDQWWRTAVANWNPIQTYHHEMIFVGDSISWVNVSRTLDWWGCFLLLQNQGWSQPSMWLYRVSCRSATEVLGWTWSICLIRKTLNSITKYLITTNQLLFHLLRCQLKRENHFHYYDFESTPLVTHQRTPSKSVFLW